MLSLLKTTQVWIDRKHVGITKNPSGEFRKRCTVRSRRRTKRSTDNIKIKFLVLLQDFKSMKRDLILILRL